MIFVLLQVVFVCFDLFIVPFETVFVCGLVCSPLSCWVKW